MAIKPQSLLIFRNDFQTLSVLPAVVRYGRKQESFRLICLSAKPDDLIPQHGRILVLHHPRGLAHALLQLLDLPLELLLCHLHAAFALVLGGRRGGNFDEVADGFDDGFRDNAMLLVIRVLNLAAAGGFVHGRAHGGGDFVGVKKYPALGVSRGAADGLD